MSLEQIEGHNGYVKNTNNNAVLNINKKEIVPKDGVEDWVLDLNKKSSWIRIVNKVFIVSYCYMKPKE